MIDDFSVSPLVLKTIEVVNEIKALVRRYDEDATVSFHDGALGRGDPRYKEAHDARVDRLHNSEGNRNHHKWFFGLSFHEEDPDHLTQELDPLLNWRVTAESGEHVVHVMAADAELATFGVAMCKRDYWADAEATKDHLTLSQARVERTCLEYEFAKIWNEIEKRNERSRAWNEGVQRRKERELAESKIRKPLEDKICQLEDEVGKLKSQLHKIELIDVVAIFTLVFFVITPSASGVAGEIFEQAGIVTWFIGIAFFVVLGFIAFYDRHHAVRYTAMKNMAARSLETHEG